MEKKKESWSQKLKRELREAETKIKDKNDEVEALLKKHSIGKKIYQTALWMLLAFVAGALIF